MSLLNNSPQALSKTQIKYLKGMAHHLKPVIMLGNQGASEALIKELDTTLDHHELVKIKLSAGDHEARQQQIDRLLEASLATQIDRIGNMLTVFRRNQDHPQLALPK